MMISFFHFLLWEYFVFIFYTSCMFCFVFLQNMSKFQQRKDVAVFTDVNKEVFLTDISPCVSEQM